MGLGWTPLRGHSGWRRPEVYVPALAVLVLLFIPVVVTQKYYLHVIINIFLYASLGHSWNIIGGYGRQNSLGHGVFFGIGAYTSTMLDIYFNLSPWIGLFIGMALAVLVAALIGYATFRLSGAYFTIATVAFAQVMVLLFERYREITKGAEGLTIPFRGNNPWYFQWNSKVPYYYLALVFMLALTWLVRRLENSRLGYYLAAIGQNERAAMALGINPIRVRLAAFAISAAIAALLGTFYAQYTYFIEPRSVFSVDVGVQIALAAIVGGLATPMGPVLGALIMQPLTELTQGLLGSTLPGLHLLVYGALLIVMILFRPTGLVGWLSDLYARMLRVLPGGQVRAASGMAITEGEAG